MERPKRTPGLLFTLFKSTFILSAFTIGGGYVIVPLMQKKFVEELKWIEEEEMLDLVAIGQSMPGVLAVNASVLMGYRVAGYLGSFVTLFGTVLPPLLIITIISYFYTNFRENPVIDALMLGMQAGVAAIILHVVLGMLRGVLKTKDAINLLILIASFVAGFVFDVHVVLIIFIAGLAGYANVMWKQKQEENK